MLLSELNKINTRLSKSKLIYAKFELREKFILICSAVLCLFSFLFSLVLCFEVPVLGIFAILLVVLFCFIYMEYRLFVIKKVIKKYYPYTSEEQVKNAIHLIQKTEFLEEIESNEYFANLGILEKDKFTFLIKSLRFDISKRNAFSITKTVWTTLLTLIVLLFIGRLISFSCYFGSSLCLLFTVVGAVLGLALFVFLLNLLISCISKHRETPKERLLRILEDVHIENI